MWKFILFLITKNCSCNLQVILNIWWAVDFYFCQMAKKLSPTFLLNADSYVNINRCRLLLQMLTTLIISCIVSDLEVNTMMQVTSMSLNYFRILYEWKCHIFYMDCFVVWCDKSLNELFNFYESILFYHYYLVISCIKYYTGNIYGMLSFFLGNATMLSGEDEVSLPPLFSILIDHLPVTKQWEQWNRMALWYTKFIDRYFSGRRIL